MELLDVRVARLEPNDVLHVRPSPLIDALVVVSHDAEVDGWRGESLDKGFLGRVNVLVLVHDELPERVMYFLVNARVAERVDRPGNNLAVGKEAMILEIREVPLIDVPERILKLTRLKQLVLDDFDTLRE